MAQTRTRTTKAGLTPRGRSRAGSQTSDPIVEEVASASAEAADGESAVATQSKSDKKTKKATRGQAEPETSASVADTATNTASAANATRARNAAPRKRRVSTRGTTTVGVGATKKPKRTKQVKKDAVLERAVDVARAALTGIVADEMVGEYLEAKADGERLLTHYFACLHPGYVGWAWAVTMTRVPRSKTPTVCEIERLPHEGALLAPEWLPWEQRMNPADGSNNDDDDYDAAYDGRLTPGRRKGDNPDPLRHESVWEVDPLVLNDMTLEVIDPAYFWPEDDPDTK